MLSYKTLNLGITNQKIALFGLGYEALKTGENIVLPSLCAFDANNDVPDTYPLSDFF